MPDQYKRQILFDVVTKVAVLLLHDQMKIIGPFENRQHAILEAQEYARLNGWIPFEKPDFAPLATRHRRPGHPCCSGIQTGEERNRRRGY